MLQKRRADANTGAVGSKGCAPRRGSYEQPICRYLHA